MKARTVMCCCAAALVISPSATMGYKEKTHERLSLESAAVSQLQNDPELLVKLGLKLTDKFKNTEGADRNISELIGDGAKFEDNFPRSLNHFFDPLNDRGLGGVNLKSPDWALEDKADLGAQQEFSYKDARQYFYDALTQADKAKREENFGRTFQTLGQVIHHVQDMAQPQHVRNDDHCDIWPCRVVPGLHNPSLYEKYSDEQREKGALPYTGYDSSMFPAPRQFWTGGIGGDGRGIADFTNANFVSAGTNFLLLGGVAAPGRYVEPTPLAETAEPIEPLFAAKNIPLPPECVAPNPPCTMSFFSSLVWDKYLNNSEVNSRASSLSIFDQDLKVYGKTVTYTDPDNGNTYTSDRLFALNSFNFDEAHVFLIPRAVGYSVGLINYFFRGKMDVEPDPAKNGKFVVRNLGPDTMTGEFEVYYDGVDDKRYSLSASTLSAIAGQTTDSFALLAIPGNLPEAKTPGEYMLAFRGDMGEELASNGSVGAVTGKVFNDPYQMGLLELLFEASNVEFVGLFGRLGPNSTMGDLVALTNEAFSLQAGGLNLPCTVYSAALVYCYNVDYPYEEFYFDPTGKWGGGVPQIEWNKSPYAEGTVTLSLGGAVLFSFSYSAAGRETYSPVTFSSAFRWNTSSTLQLTSGGITW